MGVISRSKVVLNYNILLASKFSQTNPVPEGQIKIKLKRSNAKTKNRYCGEIIDAGRENGYNLNQVNYH